MTKSQVDHFNPQNDKNVKWFATPPIDVVPTPSPYHSLEYLYQKSKRSTSETDQTVADEVMETPTEVTAQEPKSPVKRSKSPVKQNGIISEKSEENKRQALLKAIEGIGHAFEKELGHLLSRLK